MPNTLIAFAGIAAGAVAFGYGWRVLNSDSGEEALQTDQDQQADQPEFVAGKEMPPGLKTEEQQITLKALSQLWATGEVKQLRFDQLSELWRAPSAREKKKKREPILKHEEITKFYLDRIKGRPFFLGDALSASIDLLELLDRDGDCPSVVNLNKDEPEKAYDSDSYNILARVKLYQHSINVACQAGDSVGKGTVVPKAILAGLAHDLGKLPTYYGKFYRTSQHPSCGLAVAETVASLKNLKWFAEISSAITHHHIQSEEYLDDVIRKADQAARRAELTSLIAPPQAPPAKVEVEAEPARQAEQFPELVDVEASASAPPVAAPPAPAKPAPAAPPKAQEKPTAAAKPVGSAPPVEPAAPTPTAARQRAEEKPKPAAKPAEPDASAEPAAAVVPKPLPPAAAPVETSKADRQRVARQLRDIYGWFDPDLFVKELSRIINTTQTGDRFWSALELKGYVYVKPLPFYTLLVRHSKNDPAVVAAASSEQDKDDYIYSAVMELRKLNDLVATEFLGSNMYAAVFLHNPGPNDPGSKQFLIPFRAAYFGEEIDRAEARRNTLMKKTVALVPAFKKRS